MDAKAEIETQAKEGANEGAKEGAKESGRERRIHERFTRVMLTVRLGGRTYKTANWSMGGFMLDDYEGDWSTGSLVTVAGLGRSTRKLHNVDLPARVVRTSAHDIAVNFLSLDNKAYDFLQTVMSETGKMRTLLDESS